MAAAQKERKVYTWWESIDAVFGEGSLFTYKILLPYYTKQRSMDDISAQWLKEQAAKPKPVKKDETKAGDKKTLKEVKKTDDTKKSAESKKTD